MNPKLKEKLKRIFCFRNRIIFLVLILVLSVALYFIPGGRDAAKYVFWKIVPIDCPREVILPSGPAEMGAAHGGALKYSVKLLSRVYVRMIICRNDDAVYEKRAADAVKFFDGLPARWTDEITALANAAGVDKEALMIGNSFLDLGFYTACRQIITTSGGTTLHAHNMDWDNLGGFGNFMITVFRTDSCPSRLKTVFIAFPGMIGALDIINERGISLSFNQTGNPSTKPKTAIFIKMREIAETCSTFEEADKEIMNMPESMPFCIGLADAKTCRTAVYERRDSEVKRREPLDNIITADNNFWHGRKMDEGCPVDFISRRAGVKDKDGIIEVLRNRSVLLECNIYSLIWDYRNNCFYLACGTIPAANGTYRKFTLF